MELWLQDQNENLLLCVNKMFLEAFYNKLDDGEESFLENRFIDEDDKDHDYKLESGSDYNEAENEADVTKVEQEIEQTEEEDVEVENIVKEYTDSKKKVNMEGKTNKDKQIHKRGAENVYQNTE